MVGCSHIRSKTNFRPTARLCDYKPNVCGCNLYIEVYCVYAMGALGSDVDSYYLTDLTNFRVYLGTADEEEERIIVKCKGDSILVEKTVNTSSIKEWNWPKVVERKTYSLSHLTSLNNF